ncbi:MAG: DUF1295 domain-containing protein [Planctomycetaceae bacterium]
MDDILLNNAAVVAAIMLAMWLISIPLRNVSVIDPVWGPGFVAIAWSTYAGQLPEDRHVMLPVLVTIWGMRLGCYLAWRNHGNPEDFRYRAMRERHGHRFVFVSLFTVFALQGVVMWLVSLPIQTTGRAPGSWTPFLIVGVIVWLIGFVFESVGDWQLAGFRADPANSGKVFNRGLWRYTRHPNYFGDFCVWWGFFLIASADGAVWWSAVGPLLMSVFLMKFSGVELLEKSLKSTKPDYTEYANSTSAFFPWRPRPPKINTSA